MVEVVNPDKEIVISFELMIGSVKVIKLPVRKVYPVSFVADVKSLALTVVPVPIEKSLTEPWFIGKINDKIVVFGTATPTLKQMNIIELLIVFAINVPLLSLVKVTEK